MAEHELDPLLTRILVLETNYEHLSSTLERVEIGLVEDIAEVKAALQSLNRALVGLVVSILITGLGAVLAFLLASSGAT